MEIIHARKGHYQQARHGVKGKLPLNHSERKLVVVSCALIVKGFVFLFFSLLTSLNNWSRMKKRAKDTVISVRIAG